MTNTGGAVFITWGWDGDHVADQQTPRCQVKRDWATEDARQQRAQAGQWRRPPVLQ